MKENSLNISDKYNSKINSIYLLLPLVLWILLPILSFNNFFKIITFISCSIYFLIEFNRNIFNKYSLRVLFLIILIWFIHIINQSENPKQFFHLTFFLIILLISNHLLQKNKSNYNLIISIILLLNLGTILKTIFNLSENQNIARALSKSGEISAELSQSGTGGYGFIYFNIILFPFVILHFRNLYIKKDNKLLILISGINIILIIILAWKAQYLIALIIIVFTLIIYLFKFLKHHPKIMIFSVVASIIFISGSIVSLFEDFLESTRYLQKYLGFLSLLEGGESNSSVGYRIVLYFRSLSTFLENPLIGNLRFSYNKIGAHSQILDLLAQFGLFIGSCIIYNILYLPFKILKKINKNYKLDIKITIISLTIVLLFNTIPLEIALAFLFIVLVLKNKNPNLNLIK
mgnify:CR=1 FL=1